LPEEGVRPIASACFSGAPQSSKAGVAVDAVRPVGNNKAVARLIVALGKVRFDQFARYPDFGRGKDARHTDKLFHGRGIALPRMGAELFLRGLQGHRRNSRSPA